MIRVSIGQVLATGASPRDIFIAANALLTDVAVLEFAVFAGGVQIYPAGTGDPPTFERQAVDVAGADHLHKGHYCAAFTVPALATVGVAELRWYYKITADGAEHVVSVPFEITATSVICGYGYCAIKDLRDEGLTETAALDARAALAISRASKYIEKATGDRWFEPRRRVFTIDGTGTPFLPIPEPIVAIESVVVTYDGIFSGQTELDPAAYKVYARHLTDGMTGGEDDRQAPKLELYTAESIRFACEMTKWPRGNRNIQVTGVFGYTDNDGSPAGCTPDQIREACTALAFQKVPRVARGVSRTGAIKSETTRDQSVQYADGPTGMFSGDVGIDQIIEAFHRPMRISAI